MIRRIRLKQWRSYEALDVTLTSGTTFVVAPNGVGKTSLVFGLGWAVFGDESGIDARSSIRAGAETAEVHVELLLPDGRQLSITRTVGRRGRPKVTAELDGLEIEEERLTEVLKAGFELDLAVAARLSLMLGGGHLASRDAIDLESHLYHAFGVEGLLAAAVRARDAAKEAEKQRRAVRTTNQERLADRSEIESEIAGFEATLERHGERGVVLEEQRREADRVRRLVERVSIYDEQLRRYGDELRRVVEEARTLGAVPDGLAALDREHALELLRDRREDAARQAREAAEGYASAQGMISASNEALALLSGDSARCPTCLRSIDAHELQQAKAEHDRRARTAADEVERYAQAQEAHRSRSAELAALVARLEALEPPTPPEVTHLPVDAADAESKYSAALTAVDRHNQEVGRLEARLEQLRARISSDERLAESEQELELTYRREGIAVAAAQAFEEAAIRVTERLIEPIAAEVRWRWKQLFSSDGLTLRPDGSIVRFVAGEELGWDTLSGGERIWARIITHLLVIASSTKLTFACFDEPLEHLDPQLRHTVAATLATAAQLHHPAQLIVTTYEHAIADQLSQDIPGTSLINVRSSRVDWDPSKPPRNKEEPDRL